MTAALRSLRLLAWLGLGLAAAGCSDEGAAPTSPAGAVPAEGLAVLHSDYRSSSLSIVDPSGPRLAWDAVLHSGSRQPALSTALSGDVVLPPARHPAGWITLLDRYPNGVLTWLSPRDGAVLGQLSVATGFPANPHDLLYLPDGRAYLSRYDSNPAPQRADGLDAGDDLLILAPDPPAARILGRIALSEQACERDGQRLPARPDRLVWADERAWVSLGCMSRGFDRGGPAVVLGVDPSRDAVDARLEIPQGANCGGLALEPGGGALWLVCSGVFQEGPAAQLARSGLARVLLEPTGPRLDRFYGAADLLGHPLGLEVAVDEEGRVFAIDLGDLDAARPDRIFWLRAEAPTARVLQTAPQPFSLTGLLRVGATLWLGQAHAERPRLLGFHLGPDAPEPWTELDSAPSVGLPPRWIASYGALP